MAAEISGGKLIAQMLAAEGVTDIFGIIDGTYVGLYRALADSGITLHSPRHEAAAAHMAGTYARLTGRLGVVIASNGPGVANMLPGVAVEQGEGNRVLLITSARRVGVGHPERGGTYQYFDQTAVIGPMSKWSGYVPSADRIGELLRRAMRISFAGRPGVVHLDVPEDIINRPLPGGAPAVQEPASYRRTSPLLPDPALIVQAAKLLVGAQRPVIHAGSGVFHADAEAELARLAELLAAPVTTSWAGRGVLSEDHAEAIPMIALEQTDKVRAQADVVLVVGSRLGETDWWGKPPNWGPPATQRTIQIDVDEERIGVNKPVELALQADAKAALAALGDAVSAAVAGAVVTGAADTGAAQTDAAVTGAEPTGTAVPNLAERRNQLAGWQSERADLRAKLDKPAKKSMDSARIHPGLVPTIAQSVMPDDTIWVLDGGNTVVWANFYLAARTIRSMVSTYKFGMLGAGFGQALGAAIAAPDRRVCVLIGDGAFGMHASEIETAVRLELPIVFVVFVDGQWGMVKMSQQIAVAPVETIARRMLTGKPLPKGKLVYADFAAARYDELATSLGAHGEYVDAPGQLRDALARARDCGGPAVVHVKVDNNEHLWAPGLQAFKKMHQEPKG